jgi:hypothetical protein
MCGRFTHRYTWREIHDLYGLRATLAKATGIGQASVYPVLEATSRRPGAAVLGTPYPPATKGRVPK